MDVRTKERAKAGGAGVMIGVIVMWTLNNAVGFEPPPEVRDAMMGLIVIGWGVVHSRFIGAA